MSKFVVCNNWCHLRQLVLTSSSFCILYIIQKPRNYLDIDTDIEYTAVNDVQVTNPDTSPGTGGATANVDTYVSACKCDIGSFECNNNAISSSNTLSVCIKSSSADVELMNLTSLDLLQAGTNEAMSVVLNNAEVESSISTIEGGKLTRLYVLL